MHSDLEFRNLAFGFVLDIILPELQLVCHVDRVLYRMSLLILIVAPAFVG